MPKTSITLFCLVKGETTANAFSVRIKKNKLIGDLKKVIKAKKAPEFDHFPADKLKLWRVSIPTKQQSSKLTAVSKFSVNIEDELGGVELSPIDDISEHFDEKKSIKKNLHIIVEPPTEKKVVYCTASYNLTKNINFQWTVTREMVTLEGLKKKVYGYFTFPDGTEFEHLIISRVIGGMKRKISRANKSSKSSKSSSPNQEKLDKVSTDEDLAIIIWTSAPSVDLEIVVDTWDTCELLFIYIYIFIYLVRQIFIKTFMVKSTTTI
jgi:hypothetical protein